VGAAASPPGSCSRQASTACLMASCRTAALETAETQWKELPSATRERGSVQSSSPTSRCPRNQSWTRQIPARAPSPAPVASTGALLLHRIPLLGRALCKGAPSRAVHRYSDLRATRGLGLSLLPALSSTQVRCRWRWCRSDDASCRPPEVDVLSNAQAGGPIKGAAAAMVSPCLLNT
jgi:hypothetical protein